MKFILEQKRLSYVKVQRNLLAGVCTILLATTLLQTIFIFFKKERIVISPPDTHQSYWVEGDRFSKSYVEEMALFFTHLLLDVSEANVLPHGEILLRYVSSDAYGTFKEKLLSDQKRLKKQQLSLHFNPHAVQILNDNLSAEITGHLISFVGAQKISQVQETYRIKFINRKDRLFLNSFQMIKSEKENFDESP